GQAAGAGQFLVGARTTGAVRGPFEFGDQVVIEAKGKPAGVLGRLLHARSPRRGRGRTALRRRSWAAKLSSRRSSQRTARSSRGAFHGSSPSSARPAWERRRSLRSCGRGLLPLPYADAGAAALSARRVLIPPWG